MTGPLADVFVEWTGLAPDDHRSVLEIQEVGCFDLHGLHWQESFIAKEGRHRICHYRAPDAESVRIAFRQGGIAVTAVWSGTLLDFEDATAPQLALEQGFAPPFPRDPADAVSRVRRDCLSVSGLRLLRAIVPSGQRRIICLCDGTLPAHRTAAFAAWACRHVSPAAM